MVVLITNISAVEYFQIKDNLGNQTTRIHAFVFNGDDDGTADFIKGGEPLEVYVDYRSYIDSWNQLNPYSRVEYCNLKVHFLAHGTNYSSLVLDQNLTGDLYENKYYANLQDNDGIEVDMICKFQQNQTLEIPADFSIVTPTWECKMCQQYEFSKVEVNLIKAQTLGDFSVVLVSYIKNFVLMQYEIVLILVWVLLIYGLFFAFGLVFSFIYFMIMYLRSVVR